MSVSFLHRPIVFLEPERAVHPPSWLDYTPFAFWIVDALRPETVVELGCQSGNSYSSFAQAVQTLGLSSACYAVDTWRGDAQAGFFDESVYEEWSAYHDHRFSTFSRLLRTTFDEALERFADGGIDLLHLDGCHTFEAVSHDFEAWRHKLSQKGVVLCHDIEVREKDFGAWRLWERLRGEYPSFEFRHGHGLGVLGVGRDFPEPIQWLFSLRGTEEANDVRRFFSRLGTAVLRRYTAVEAQRNLQVELAARDQRLSTIEADLELARAQHNESEQTRAAVQAALNETRAALDQTQAALGEATNARLASESALASASTELERVTAEVKTFAERLAGLSAANADLTTRAVDTERLTREVTALQKRASELSATEAELAARTVEVACLTSELSSVQERVGMLARELESKDQQLADRTDEIARQQVDLFDSDQRLAAAEAEVKQLSDALRSLKQRGDAASVKDGRVELSVTSLRARKDDAPPTIVVVSHVGAWRPRAGNEYRVRRMLEWYRAQGYRIVMVIAPLPGEELSSEGIEASALAFGNIIQVHRNGRIEYILRDFPDVVASLDGTRPESIAGRLGEHAETAREGELLRIERTFCHDPVVATVLHLQRSLGPHVLQVEYIWMTRLLPLVCGNVLKVLDTIDVFSSIQQKVRAFGLRDVTIGPDEEAERLSRADLILAIQDDEQAVLRRLVPAIPVVAVGVDFNVVSDPHGSRDGQLLIVASNNARNCKGVRDFLRLAWPRIHRRLPDAELVVVGSVATALTDIESPGVTILGPVDDVDARYRNAALVINPVVAGTGLKIKTLEALCHLRPVVTWPAGVEGVQRALVAHCLVASDWYDFAEQTISALRRPAAGFTADDRALIADLLAPEQVYASLDAAYRTFFEQHRSHIDSRSRSRRVTAREVVTAHAGD